MKDLILAMFNEATNHNIDLNKMKYIDNEHNNELMLCLELDGYDIDFVFKKEGFVTIECHKYLNDMAKVNDLNLKDLNKTFELFNKYHLKKEGFIYTLNGNDQLKDWRVYSTNNITTNTSDVNNINEAKGIFNELEKQLASFKHLEMNLKEIYSL